MLSRIALLAALLLPPAAAVAQEGPEADRLFACVVGQSVLFLVDDIDLQTAYSAAWDVCEPLAAAVPVEHDGVDFDGLAGLDEYAYHTVTDLAEALGKPLQ